MKLLFVCTGNTCRSPMAEALAKKILTKKGFSVTCDSAGIYANPGQKMAENAAAVLEEYGINDFSHSAKICTREMIEKSDLVIAMTENHRMLLCQLFGEQEKICTLPGGIGDPFGGDLNTYRKAAKSIVSGIEALAAKGLFHLEIRPISEEDLDEIARLEQEIFSDPWSEKALRDYLSSPSARGYVLSENKKILSYALFSTLLEEGEVLRIGTKMSALRRGFAESLLEHYFTHSKKDGVKKIFLEVRKENLAARSLYEKTGFVLIGTRKGYYKNPPDDAIIYQKTQNGTETL